MNGDEERSLEEVLAEDPDLAYALPEDEIPSDELELETPEEKAIRKALEKRETQAPAAPKLNPDVERLLGDLAADPEKLRAVLAPRQEQPAPPTRKALDLDEVAKQVESDFLESPQKGIKTLLGNILEAAKSFQTENEQKFVRASLSSADSVIDGYLSNLSARDPRMDSDVQDEMRKIINRAKAQNPQYIAQMSRDQIISALEEASAEAYGKVMLRRDKPKRDPAPNYGSSRAGGSSVATQGGSGLSLSKDERAFCSSLKSAGLNDKEIRQALREAREEGTFVHDPRAANALRRTG